MTNCMYVHVLTDVEGQIDGQSKKRKEMENLLEKWKV